jgi:hypothetical protein
MKWPSNVWFRIDALLVVLFLVHSSWLYVETRHLESARAAIRAEGGPVTFDELNRRSPGPRPAGAPATAEDACRYYRAAIALVRPFPGRSNPFERFTGASSSPTPTELAWVRKAVDDNRETFRMMDEGARHGTCRPRVDRPYDGLGVGALLRLTSLRATLLAFDGDGEAAAEALSNEVRLTQALWDQIGTVWSGYGLDLFNRDARIILERSRPSGDALDRLRSALVDLGDPHTGVLRAAETVRVWVSDQEEPKCDFLGLVREPMRIHREVADLASASAIVDVARKPWPVRAATLGGLAPRRMWSGFLLNLLRRTTQTRCTEVALALARYRLDHGALPATLADLPAGLAGQDPLTGKSLLYRAEGTRVTVYGVGANFKDDGGALTGGLGDYDGPDWGVSVTLR